MKPKVYKTKVDLKQILAATWYFPSKGLRGKREIHIFSFTSSSLSSTIKKFNETPHLQWAGPHPSQEVSWGGSVVTLSMSGFPWLKLLVFIHFFFFFSPQSSFVQLCRLSRGFAPKPSRYSQLLSCVSHEINPVSVLRLLLAPAAIWTISGH